MSILEPVRYPYALLASWIHGLWGATILTWEAIGVPMPRPFGSQEAFLLYFPPWAMAAMMLGGAIVCRFGITAADDDRPWLRLLLAIPQQLIFLYSLFWGIWQFLDGLHGGAFDARGWLALGYLGPLSLFHARDIRTMYGETFLWLARNFYWTPMLAIPAPSLRPPGIRWVRIGWWKRWRPLEG